MSVKLDFEAAIDLPPMTQDVEELFAEVLQEVVAEVTENLRHHAPRQTGELQANFTSYDVELGAVLENNVRYASYVREFKGMPPLPVLAYTGIRDLAAKRLEERGDDLAASVLRYIMRPIIAQARQAARG